MIFIKNFFRIIFEFIFPKDNLIKEIESKDAEELFERWPKAEIKQKHIISIFDYKHKEVRRTIYELKYHNNERIAEIFGEIIFNYSLEISEDERIFHKKKFILIPIPSHRAKKRERGFNQTEIILQKIKNLDKDKIFLYDFSSLQKIKNTKRQTEVQTAKERRENLQNAFSVKNPEVISGAKIILIDDVSTTGSTLKEARKTLLCAGAKSVICISIAG